MNYEKHYKLLCQTRQQLNRQKLPAGHTDYVYYEWHHIVPKHENGSDEASNLVLLTAREHFIAHWLFAKWKRTRGAWAALAYMGWSTKELRKLDSRQFGICRAAASLANAGRERRSLTEAEKAHLSACNKGKSPPNKGKPMSQDQLAKISGTNSCHYGKPSKKRGKPAPESARIARRLTCIADNIAKHSYLFPAKLVTPAGEMLELDSVPSLFCLCENACLNHAKMFTLLRGLGNSHKGYKLANAKLSIASIARQNKYGHLFPAKLQSKDGIKLLFSNTEELYSLASKNKLRFERLIAVLLGGMKSTGGWRLHN